MTFDRASGELVFAPAPGQEKVWNINVTVSDGIKSSTVAVPITVTNRQQRSTEVSGQVVDVKSHPLDRVPVMIGSTMTMTDSKGYFTLSHVASQPGPLTLDGYHADAAGDYMMLMAPTAQFLGHAVYVNADNVVPQPIVLPHIDLAHAADFSKVDQSQPLDLTSPMLPGVSLHVAPHSAMTPDGKPFTGKLALTVLPANQLREVLPHDVFPGSLFVGVDGPELMFSTPARITLPNTTGFNSGDLLDLMTMNMTTGGFDVTGQLNVSADGKLLETVSGGVYSSSCTIPSAKVPEFTGLIPVIPAKIHAA
jgi:hypothetical protein